LRSIDFEEKFLSAHIDYLIWKTRYEISTDAYKRKEYSKMRKEAIKNKNIYVQKLLKNVYRNIFFKKPYYSIMRKYERMQLKETNQPTKRKL